VHTTPLHSPTGSHVDHLRFFCFCLIPSIGRTNASRFLPVTTNTASAMRTTSAPPPTITRTSSCVSDRPFEDPLDVLASELVVPAFVLPPPPHLQLSSSSSSSLRVPCCALTVCARAPRAAAVAPRYVDSFDMVWGACKIYAKVYECHSGHANDHALSRHTINPIQKSNRHTKNKSKCCDLGLDILLRHGRQVCACLLLRGADCVRLCCVCVACIHSRLPAVRYELVSLYEREDRA
jgi:hypothetical protein